MIYVIMRSGVFRAKRNVDWRIKAITLAGATTVAGFSCGAVLALFGGALSRDLRVAVAVAAAGIGLAIGLAELLGRRVPLPQRNRETQQLWMERHPLAAVVLNGVTLGTGAATRIGFWLWYIIPTACFVGASALVGGILFGFYGLMRGLGSFWMIYLQIRAHRGGRDASAFAWAMRHRASFRNATCVTLVIVTTATLSAATAAAFA